jgi:hypothetical protein
LKKLKELRQKQTQVDAALTTEESEARSWSSAQTGIVMVLVLPFMRRTSGPLTDD